MQAHRVTNGYKIIRSTRHSHLPYQFGKKTFVSCNKFYKRRTIPLPIEVIARYQ